MRDSVPSGSYSSVCNVLRQWKSRSSLLIESTDSMMLGGFYIWRLFNVLISSLYSVRCLTACTAQFSIEIDTPMGGFN